MENIKKTFTEPGTCPVLLHTEGKIGRFFTNLKDDVKILLGYLTNPLTGSENSVNFSI